MQTDSEIKTVSLSLGSLADSKKKYRYTNIPSLRTKIRKTKVYIEGELTISELNKIKEDFVATSSAFDYIDIYLQKIEELDLTMIQFLYYLKTHNNLEKKETGINTELSAKLMSLIDHSGFKDLLANKWENLKAG